MSNLNPGGLTRVLNYIKTWVTGLLNSKANSSHSHTKSQITDFPTIPSNTSQLTNDSGYITSSGSCSYANSAGWANSAGGVTWGNVSSRPTAVSQFTNDIGFITSNSLMYINGDRAHNAYRIVYGSFNNLNNISTGRCWVSFPSAFSSAPTVVMTISNPDGLYNYQISNTTTTGFIAEIWDGSGNRTSHVVAWTYIAIGNS